MCLLFVLAILFVFYLAYRDDGFGPGKQAWGYSEVRPGAFIFWWLYYAHSVVDDDPANIVEKPLIIWLQGGPGGSSTGYGNFEEIGPLDRTLHERSHTWVNDYHVLFVDSPVGSGFSYTEDPSLLARNSSTVVSDLMAFLKDFYRTIERATSIDWEATVPLYIASESYGGRTAVEFAYALDQAGRTGTVRCRLRGVFLGNAWLSPLDSIGAWPDYLHRMGYLGERGRKRVERRVAAVREKVEQQQLGKAMDGWHTLQDVILEETGGLNCYHILKPSGKEKFRKDENSDEVLEYGETEWWKSPDATRRLSSLEALMQGPVPQKLGLANRPPWGAQQNAVFDALSEDFLRSSVGTVERLLNETTIDLILYNGHLDLITCLPGTLAWIRRIFGQQEKPFHATREPFSDDGIDSVVEGYRSAFGPRFTLYTVLRAGHMVPADNPTAMAHILRAHIAPT
ncbi:retinoid-inducible serine carboxypeptidase-like [Anopheles coustani]|uniref:retinoid-inducible serine carboxypeptidase-like n=1 Tax=Anopheles coustani TaxID=139045 RepID=UPI00265A6803|nr:retinoid-inducible serine carboxypeptidase-like [Anopheles coustani]